MNPLIIDGLKLLVIGMSGVFLFLALIVVLISVTAKVIAPVAHILEPPPAQPKTRKKPSSKGAGDNSNLAAAVAAVHMHRQDGK